MSRRAQIIGETIDIFGVCWDVRERRPTKHGWDVFIGWPQGEPAPGGDQTMTRPASPTPDQVFAAREKSGLTQDAAARLVHADIRSWQRWESGERSMHPAFFELFLIKTGQR